MKAGDDSSHKSIHIDKKRLHSLHPVAGRRPPSHGCSVELAPPPLVVPLQSPTVSPPKHTESLPSVLGEV